jgi:cellulose synthase/poly-beta-1,6-N-acetylglucosamine synthase-like glycosyltransferase
MKISVALASCNGANYIAAQLESLTSQSRLPDELVVVDDQSSDTTADILQAFAKRAPFAVRIMVRQARGGCNVAFAEAMAMCTGDIVAICDQDDVWLPDHVALLAEPFARDDAVGIVTSDSLYVDDSLTSLNTTFWKANRFSDNDVRRIYRGPQFTELAKHLVLAGHASAFRRSLLSGILPLDTMMYDHWLGLICAASSKIVFVATPLTLHRRHQKQLSLGNQDMTLAQRAIAQPSTAAEHFCGLAAQWESLWRRLSQLPKESLHADVQAAFEGRIRLLKARAAMRRSGNLARWAAACWQLASGGYHRHGRGFLTFLRDLRG